MFKLLICFLFLTGIASAATYTIPLTVTGELTKTTSGGGGGGGGSYSRGYYETPIPTTNNTTTLIPAIVSTLLTNTTTPTIPDIAPEITPESPKISIYAILTVFILLSLLYVGRNTLKR